MIKQISMQEAIKILGIDHSWIGRLQRREAYLCMCKTIEEFKQVVKKRKRQLMLQYHPDRNGDSIDSKEKTQEILNICASFESMKVVRLPPRPTVMRFYNGTYGGYGSTTSASSTWY